MATIEVRGFRPRLLTFIPFGDAVASLGPPIVNLQSSIGNCLSLVRTGAVDGRHGDVVQTQVDSQLRPVMDAVVHDNTA